VIERDRLAGGGALADPGDGRYRGAWLLVTDQGRPVGELELDFSSPDATAGDLSARLTGMPTVVRPAAGPLPFASVVLPTVFGRVELLRRALAALVALDYPDFEVLLVDNRPGAAGPVPDLGAPGAQPRVRIVRAPRPGISAARNAGVREARSELIAFTDDDVVVDPGWLAALAGRLVAEPGAGCATGLVLPAELETAEQVWFETRGEGPARSYRPGLYHIAALGLTGLRPWDRRRFRVRDRYGTDPAEDFWLYQLGALGTGSNMAWRAGTLRELGGFDEALGTGTPTRGGEDIGTFVRLLFAGRCLAFEPAAFVFHIHRRTYPELRRQVNGYGRGLTSMLTAITLRDPRHAIGLLRVAGPAVRSLAGRTPAARRLAAGPGRDAAGPDAVPIDDLKRARLSGLLHGPVVYLWSRRRMRRWNR
jgi:GT2 family glycosyltransferase